MPSRVDPETGRGYRFKDRTGQRNGRLVFVGPVGLTKYKHRIWRAICDCGAVVETYSPHKTKSCGCLQAEVMANIQRAKALPPDVKAASRKASAAKQREKRKASPIAVMQARVSRLHRHALAQVGAIKTSPTFEALGYSAADFVSHIERQFVRGMGWHNMKDWQIDHIIPISTAKTAEDVAALNQLSNLRPMWARENNAKKNARTHLL